MSARILSEEQVAEVARRYDGKTTTIDDLVREFQCARHNIYSAAKRSGCKTRKRRTWTHADDEYLHANYGRLSVDEICAALDCSPLSIQNRKKRLGISTRNFEDLTVRDLEELTRIDHRLWQRFMEDGWLKYWEQPRQNASPAQRVSVDNLKAFFTAHPEVFDYRGAGSQVRGVLELNDLPDPPAFKRITCRSDMFADRTVEQCHPGPYGRGSRDVKSVDYTFSLESCSAIGGVDVWVPIYENGTCCPRCGCKISRFSEKAIFSDDAPDESGILNVIAGKLGLSYHDGRFVDSSGKALSDEDLLRYVFNTRRNPGDAIRTFRRLLETGLTVTAPNPVPASRLGPNILSYELHAGEQEQAFDAFVQHGNLGVYWPPGEGKMFFGAMVMTRLSGRHVVFANTTTIIEQWIRHLTAYAPTTHVSHKWKPSYHEVKVFDWDSNLVSTIELYSYMTRADFKERKYVVAAFDEAHFLPGNNAHRLAMIDCEYRVGLTATPFREDGRADLIQTMTGHSVGEDWQKFADAGTMQRVPVRLLLVDDLEQKFEALPAILRDRKTLVFVELLADGERLAADLQAPFLSSASKRRLEVIDQHQVTVVSRVADCGIDVPSLEDVIEFSFHHGSRAQSLQRFGRLLHADKPLQHTVMMTREEFSRYFKRLSALEEKGFDISISVFEPGPRISAPTPLAGNPWLRMMGMEQTVRTLPLHAGGRRYIDGQEVAA